MRLDVGPGKRSATARVVMCTAIRGKKDLWELGIELDVPENLWGFHFPPTDWITGESSEPLRPLDVPTAPGPEPPPAGTTCSPDPVALPPTIELPPAVSPAAGVMAASSAEAIAVATAAAPPAAEVTFSLEEISLAVTPSASPEVQPVPPMLETPPSPPPAFESPPELEAELRQTARAISAEFEEDYRRSLGELLMRLRADLEEQAAADWERSRQRAIEDLQVVAQQVRQQLEQESAARSASNADLAAQLDEIRQARDYVESLIRVLPETVDRRLQEALAARAEEWQNRLQEQHAAHETELRAQLQKHTQALTDELAAQARQRLFDDLDRHEREFLDRIAVHLEEVRASADHTREFTKRTSADIARQSEQLRVDLQTQFDSLFEGQRRDLALRLEERHRQLSQAAHTALQNLGGRLWESLRRQLNTDFEARNRELRDTLQAAQAETRELREHTEQLAARLDKGLQARLDEAVARAAERAQKQFEQLLAATREESLRQLQADQEQVRASREQAQHTLAESLQVQRTALLAEFRRDTEAIAADSRLKFQGAMRQTLDSIGEILGPQPPQPGTTVEPGAKES